MSDGIPVLDAGELLVAVRAASSHDPTDLDADTLRRAHGLIVAGRYAALRLERRLLAELDRRAAP